LEGDDLLYGLGGDDLMNGGSGNDTLKGGGGADFLNGLQGIDTASYYESHEGVVVLLNANAGAGGDAEGDNFQDIENLTGSVYADTLWGDDGINKLMGMDGNDILKGFGGADSIHGGNGNDTLHGMDGNDTPGETAPCFAGKPKATGAKHTVATRDEIMTTNKPGRLNALMLALAPVFFERRQRALQRLAAMAAEKANPPQPRGF
jgi:hypothetical protein